VCEGSGYEARSYRCPVMLQVGRRSHFNSSHQSNCRTNQLPTSTAIRRASHRQSEIHLLHLRTRAATDSAVRRHEAATDGPSSPTSSPLSIHPPLFGVRIPVEYLGLKEQIVHRTSSASHFTYLTAEVPASFSIYELAICLP